MTAAIESLRAASAKPLPPGEVFMAHGVVMLDKGGGDLDALDRDDYVMACINAAPDLLAELDRLTAERDALRALLKRYRNEVPLGHQPHMLAHEVDTALKEPA